MISSYSRVFGDIARQEKIIVFDRNKQVMRKICFLFLLIPLLSAGSDQAPVLPARGDRWLDRKPISWNQLRGQVVMLNVWTFG